MDGLPIFVDISNYVPKSQTNGRFGLFIKFGNSPLRNLMVPPANYACMDNPNIILGSLIISRRIENTFGGVPQM